MNASDLANLKDLLGGWSWLMFGLGLAGASICHFSLKVGRSIHAPDRDTAVVCRRCAVVMLLLAVFVGIFVTAASTAYSGPLPPEARVARPYDATFAAAMALAFGIAFAFAAFRLRRSRTPNIDGQAKRI